MVEEYLDSDNLEFIKSLQYKSLEDSYRIEKRGGDDNKPIYYVYDIYDYLCKNRKILKIVSLDNNDKEYLNTVIDGVKSICSLERKSNRYISYNDMFLSKCDFLDSHMVLCYVYDMVKGKDLFEWTDRFDYRSECGKMQRYIHKFISLEYLVNIAYSIFASLRILHLNGIYHRDIKPDNIIIENPNFEGGFPRLKFIDFDYAGTYKKCKFYPGTDIYAPLSVLTKRIKGTIMTPDDWEYCDVTSACISILRMYGGTNKRTWSTKENRFSEEFSKDIEMEVAFRKRHSLEYNDREKDFIQYMIDCSYADLYKHVSHFHIIEHLEKNYGNVISGKLIESYRRDLELLR